MIIVHIWFVSGLAILIDISSQSFIIADEVNIQTVRTLEEVIAIAGEKDIYHCYHCKYLSTGKIDLQIIYTIGDIA